MTSKPTETVLIEFTAALKNGRGRAMIILQANPEDPQLHEALWHACTTDLRYDTDEDDRAAYLHRLLATTGKLSIWRDRLSVHLAGRDPQSGDRDTRQVFDILCRLAVDDPDVDRSRLRDFFAASDVSRNGFLFAQKLIRLDGVDTILACIEMFGADLVRDPWTFSNLIYSLEIEFGAADAAAQILTARRRFPEFEALMLQNEAEYAVTASQPQPKIDYEEAKAALAVQRYFPREFYEHADTDSLKLAATDLLAATETSLIKAYFRLFTVRDFPMEPSLLFKFLDDPDVSFFASKALGRLQSPKIRDIALSLLDDRSQLAMAMRLLSSSYRPGDMDLILNLIDAQTVDEDELHNMQFAFKYILKHSSIVSDEEVRMLERVHELGPCSMCRASILEAFSKRNSLPTGILQECAFDADPPEVETQRIPL